MKKLKCYIAASSDTLMHLQVVLHVGTKLRTDIGAAGTNILWCTSICITSAVL